MYVSLGFKCCYDADVIFKVSGGGRGEGKRWGKENSINKWVFKENNVNKWILKNVFKEVLINGSLRKIIAW